MKVDTLLTVVAKYEVIIDAMEIINFRSNGDANRDAASYSRMLGDLKFVVSLVVANTFSVL